MPDAAGSGYGCALRSLTLAAGWTFYLDVQTSSGEMGSLGWQAGDLQTEFAFWDAVDAFEPTAATDATFTRDPQIFASGTPRAEGNLRTTFADETLMYNYITDSTRKTTLIPSSENRNSIPIDQLVDFSYPVSLKSGQSAVGQQYTNEVLPSADAMIQAKVTSVTITQPITNFNLINPRILANIDNHAEWDDFIVGAFGVPDETSLFAQRASANKYTWDVHQIPGNLQELDWKTQDQTDTGDPTDFPYYGNLASGMYYYITPHPNSGGTKSDNYNFARVYWGGPSLFPDGGKPLGSVAVSAVGAECNIQVVAGYNALSVTFSTPKHETALGGSASSINKCEDIKEFSTITGKQLSKTAFDAKPPTLSSPWLMADYDEIYVHQSYNIASFDKPLLSTHSNGLLCDINICDDSAPDDDVKQCRQVDEQTIPGACFNSKPSSGPSPPQSQCLSSAPSGCPMTGFSGATAGEKMLDFMQNCDQFYHIYCEITKYSSLETQIKGLTQVTGLLPAKAVFEKHQAAGDVTAKTLERMFFPKVFPSSGILLTSTTKSFSTSEVSTLDSGKHVGFVCNFTWKGGNSTLRGVDSFQNTDSRASCRANGVGIIGDTQYPQETIVPQGWKSSGEVLTSSKVKAALGTEQIKLSPTNFGFKVLQTATFVGFEPSRPKMDVEEKAENNNPDFPYWGMAILFVGFDIIITVLGFRLSN